MVLTVINERGRFGNCRAGVRAAARLHHLVMQATTGTARASSEPGVRTAYGARWGDREWIVRGAHQHAEHGTRQRITGDESEQLRHLLTEEDASIDARGRLWVLLHEDNVDDCCENRWGGRGCERQA